MEKINTSDYLLSLPNSLETVPLWVNDSLLLHYFIWFNGVGEVGWGIQCDVYYTPQGGCQLVSCTWWPVLFLFLFLATWSRSGALTVSRTSQEMVPHSCHNKESVCSSVAPILIFQSSLGVLNTCITFQNIAGTRTAPYWLPMLKTKLCCVDICMDTNTCVE